MNDVEKLKEQRAKLVANARVIIDSAESDARELSSEEKATVDAMFADADKVGEQVEDAERKAKLAKLEAEQRASAGVKSRQSTRYNNNDLNDNDRKKAVRSWALAPTGSFTADDEVLASQYGISLRTQNLSVRALSKSVNTVPVGFASEIEKQLKYYSDIRSVAKHLVTDSGQDIDYPTVTDVSNVAAIVGENSSIATNVDPTFSKKVLKAWKYASPTILVSLELLQDNAVDIEKLLAELLSERVARGQEAHFVNGNGSTQPEGLAAAATVGVNLATGNAMTFDKIIDLVHSVDKAYRNGASFLMNDTTVAACRKVKSAVDGQYIWSPSVVAGTPDSILGYPVNVSNEMTSFASPGDDAPLILFGDMSKYLIRDVGPSTTVARLDQLYMATGQIGFVLLQRTDGRYIGHSGCVKSLNSFDAE